MIEAFRLGVFSRGKTLWDGLDFAFGDGSATVIVGPPSCGKTLLLSVLRGERRPDAGDVLVSGESVYRGGGEAARAFRASSGYVSERPEPDAALTVDGLFLRSAMMCGRLSAGERRERRERLLSMVGLPGSEDVRLSALSASERVRAALAAELLRNPKVLFTDGLAQAAGSPHAEMLGSLFRALAGAGNIILSAERKLPDGWAAFAGKGRAAGPFLVHGLPAIAAKGGPS
jgi:ABC-type multidrug transport system ATPase subunit